MKNKLVYLLGSLTCAVGLPLLAQAQTNLGGVGIGTATPDASALLDLTSISKGVLAPRMTASQRAAIASPAQGLLVYQTDGVQLGFWYYSGTAWTYLNPTAAGDNLGNHTATQDLNLGGNAINFDITQMRQVLNLSGTAYGIGVQPNVQYFRSVGGFAWYRGGSHSVTQGEAGVGGDTPMVLTPAGNLGVGTGNPGQRLEVAGNVQISGAGNGLLFPDGTTQTTASGPGLFIQNSTAKQASASFNVDGSGAVGGILTAGGGLRVNGKSALELGAGIANKESNAGKIGYRLFSGGLDIVGAGTTSSSRRIYFYNEGGAYYTGNVGIGINPNGTPSQALEVAGNVQISGGGNGLLFPDGTALTTAALPGDNLGNHTASQTLNLNGQQLIGANRLDLLAGADDKGNSDPGAIAFQYQYGGYRHWLRSRHSNKVTDGGNNLDFFLNNSTDANGSSVPGTGSLQVLTLQNNNSQPRVGIGTAAPSQALEVAGQVYSSTGGFRFPDNTVQATAAALTLSGQTLGVSGGNSVTLPSQQLSLSGSTLSLTNGGSVALPQGADNLGNHTATQNLNLAGYQLVSGGSAGLSITNAGSVGVGTTTPSAKALLDVASTSKGVLLPRLTTAQRDAMQPAASDAGLLVYNTTQALLNYWNGAQWVAYLADNTPASGTAPFAPVTFGYTGAPQTYIVPAGVTSIRVDMAGAQAFNAGNVTPSTKGGRVQGVLKVTPGQTLTIYVGGINGYNGGGTGTFASGRGGSNGGGGTDVRLGGAALSNRVLVAAGSGGSTYDGRSKVAFGGEGGGLTGGDGQGSSFFGTYSNGGSGGSQTAGSSLGQGENADMQYVGGGGGGGYYGGKAGTYLSAGGGGSSYADATLVTGVVHTANYNGADGYVTLTPGGLAAPALDASNFVNVPGDNLGNHTATKALNLNGNAITFGQTTQQMLNLWSTNYGLGVQSNTQYFRTAANFAWYSGGSHSDTELSAGAGGTAQMVLKAGQLGIGTSSPQGALDVPTGTVHLPKDSWINYFGDNKNYLRGTTILADDPQGGYVGIGTTNPSQKLDVAGNANVSGAITVAGPLTAGGNASVAGALGFGSTTRQMLNLWGTTYGLGVQNNTQYFRTVANFAWYSGGSHSDAALDPGTNGTAQMVLKAGQLGIGTSSPQGALDVATGTVRLPGGGGGDTWFNYSGDNKNYLRGTTVLADQGGRVGIGTANPAFPLDVQSSVTPGNYPYAYFAAASNGTATSGSTGGSTGPVSIRATGRILASEFNATSDRRLKNVIGLSNNAADLGLLTKLRITDYTMRDQAQYGQRQFKKVIAQEVEAIFPQAVNQHAGFLPDVYASVLKAEVQADSLLVLTLPTAPAAKAGQRIKLIGQSGEVVGTVQAARGTSLTVRGARQLAGQPVFVFGLEHADVRTVDYEALAMLNVSATQELARQLAELQKQNAALKAEAAGSRADLQKFKAEASTQTAELAQRLQALENMLGAKASVK